MLQPPHSHITWDLQVATAQWGRGGGKTTRRREPENNQVSRDPAVGGGLQ